MTLPVTAEELQEHLLYSRANGGHGIHPLDLNVRDLLGVHNAEHDRFPQYMSHTHES